MTSMMLLAVVVLCLALFYQGAFEVRAVEPVAALTGDLTTNELESSAYYYSADDPFSFTSPYKYVTLHHHRGHNCSREIRFNVTFHLDTCFNATYPWYNRFYEGSLNSFSFYYNVNTTRYGDTYLQPYSINMISYFDDACTPADHYEAETQRGGVEPITCERGFSYTLSNEMPSVPSVASYIK
jgi:hypothetical protein